MQYTAHIRWKRSATPFNTKTFDRTHEIQFGGGQQVSASSAPEFLGKAELPNPEELFTSSISSCFMLTFLYWAATKGITIDDYQDTATGVLAKNAEGKMSMTEVTLKPHIKFHEHQVPDQAVLDELIKKAHDNCFISSSVKTQINVNPVFGDID